MDEGAPNVRERESLAAKVGRMSRSPVLQGRSWSLLLAVNIMVAVIASLTLVWLNIESMDINRFITDEDGELARKKVLGAKLATERDQFLNPHELEIAAKKFGMKEPARDQIRHLTLKPAKDGSR